MKLFFDHLFGSLAVDKGQLGVFKRRLGSLLVPLGRPDGSGGDGGGRVMVRLDRGHDDKDDEGVLL